MKSPGSTNDGEFQKDEPQAARPKKAAEFGGSPSAAVKKCACACQKEKQRGAKVGNPPGEKKRGPGAGQVFRLETEMSEKVASVVESHDHHNNAPQDVDRCDASEDANPRRDDGWCRGGGRGHGYLPDAVVRWRFGRWNVSQILTLVQGADLTGGFVVAGGAAGLAVQEAVLAEADFEHGLAEAAVFVALALRFRHFTLGASVFGGARSGGHRNNVTLERRDGERAVGNPGH